MFRKWWSEKGGAGKRAGVKPIAQQVSLKPAKNDPEDELTLNEAGVGGLYAVVDFDAGRSLQQRIFSMGLNSGARFTILSNSGRGPVELLVRQTKLGIGRGMSRKIRVKKVER